MENNYSYTNETEMENAACAETDCKKEKRRGRAGAAVRLAIAAISAVGAVISSVFAMAEATDKGFVGCITDGIAAIALVLFIAVMINSYIKYVAFVLPKSFGWACSFWRAWIPLTILGLVIKAWVWVIILLIPISTFGILISMTSTLVTGVFMMGSYNILSSLLVLVGVGVAYAGLTLLDVCKLKGVSAKDTVTHLFRSGR